MPTSIVPDPTLAVRYASGDLFRFARLTETFGNLTQEALATDAVRLASVRHHAAPSVGLHQWGAVLDRCEAFLSGLAGTQVARGAWNAA